MPGTALRRIERIFLAASGAPAAERRALLDRECNGDAQVREEVEALLGALADDAEFLEHPPAEVAATAPPHTPFNAPAAREFPSSEAPGVEIGPYRLRGLLGAGSVGEVHLADQEHPVRRRVAIKIIRLGMDSAEVAARFEAERQALALMDHPGVARVFDAGASPSGRPYFVMEYVEGVPVDAYCDAQQLSITQRLQLFRQICNAVTYAHRHAVIHRRRDHHRSHCGIAHCHGHGWQSGDRRSGAVAQRALQ